MISMFLIVTEMEIIILFFHLQYENNNVNVKHFLSQI